MAKAAKATPPKVSEESEKVTDESSVDNLASSLIKDLNREFGMRVAYNLNESTAPTIVKRWIDTGSIQLNYMIANMKNGGYPEGRIIEISGLPSCGKSHLAYHAAANVQSMGGLVVYIDTENATPVEKLKNMGINVRNRFVYVDTHCTEEVFKVVESVILKSKEISKKNVPILVIWDSVAASSPKAELDGDYDQNTMGLQARVISKAMRKITGVIGQNNVLFLCLNQLREQIGVMHGDPYVTPGGKAIPFHSSVRIRLGSGHPIKDKAGNVIGIHVTVSIKKNKVGPPFKKCEFDIHFGKGIVEHEFIFDEVRKYCADFGALERNGVNINVTGTGAWKDLTVSDSKTGEVLKSKKFYKADFGDVMKDPEYMPFVNELIEATYVLDINNSTADNGESGDSDEGDVDE